MGFTKKQENTSLIRTLEAIKNPEYLKKMFGENYALSETYQNFLYQFKSVPKENVVTIFVYGSLMNSNDIHRTLKNYSNIRPGTIRGFKRIFNMGIRKYGCFLNIEEDPKSRVNGVLIDVLIEDIPNYIVREGWYDIINIPRYSDWKPDVFLDDNNTGHPVIVVVGNPFLTSFGIEPQLNYLHLCISGIGREEGFKGISSFINNTFCYSSLKKNFITVKEYLENIDILSYMLQYEYKSR